MPGCLSFPSLEKRGSPETSHRTGDFAVKTLKFLGHLITPNGVPPDPEKVKAIT